MMEPFEKHLENEDLSPLTVRGYLNDLGQFVRWFEQTNDEAFSLPAVTPTDVREYRQHLQTVQLRKAATVNRKLASLSRLMGWALQSGSVESNLCRQIKSVQQTPSMPRWLSRQEQYTLQRAIEKDLQLAALRYPRRWLTRRRDASLVLFLLNTGLRLQEATALRLDDLQLSERKGNVFVRQGKGNKERSVPLNATARKALQDWLVVRPDDNGPFVWVAVEAETDRRLSGRAVQRVLARYGQEAGLQDLSPPVARHTFARNLVDSGVGLEKVARLLGHSNLNTTRIYVITSERDLELAVERLTG